MTCPSCGGDVGAKTLGEVFVCKCLRTLVADGDGLRFAHSGDMELLSEAGVARLRAERGQLRVNGRMRAVRRPMVPVAVPDPVVEPIDLTPLDVVHLVEEIAPRPAPQPPKRKVTKAKKRKAA